MKERLKLGQLSFAVKGFPRPLARQSGGTLLEALARVQADNSLDLLDVAQRHQLQLTHAGSVAVITPQIGTKMLKLAAAMRSWGNAVSWFALVAPTFESAADPHKSVQSYDNFVQALRRGGCQAYLIRGDVELAASFRRWQRAAV